MLIWNLLLKRINTEVAIKVSINALTIIDLLIRTQRIFSFLRVYVLVSSVIQTLIINLKIWFEYKILDCENKLLVIRLLIIIKSKIKWVSKKSLKRLNCNLWGYVGIFFFHLFPLDLSHLLYGQICIHGDFFFKKEVISKF